MATKDASSQKRYEIDFSHLSLSVRWKTVLLPFAQGKFVSLLPDEGYALDEKLHEPAPFGTTAEFGGIIARKGATTSVTMDPGRLIVGVNAKSGQTLVEELNTIEGVLKDRLFFDSPTYASFYEVLVNALVWTKQDATEVLRRLGFSKRVVSLFSEKTGIGPSTNASLRLVPVSGEMLGEDWWDFRLELSSRNPHQCYHVQIVYRNQVRSKVMKLAENIEQVIADYIEGLEESGE